MCRVFHFVKLDLSVDREQWERVDKSAEWREEYTESKRVCPRMAWILVLRKRTDLRMAHLGLPEEEGHNPERAIHVLKRDAYGS